MRLVRRSDVERWMARLLGIVSSLCGLGAIAILVRLGIAAFSAPDRLTGGALLFGAAVVLIAGFFLSVDYRLTFNRPNLYVSVLGLTGWRGLGVLFAVIAAVLAVLAAQRRELDALAYALISAAASCWCWMRALRIGRRQNDRRAVDSYLDACYVDFDEARAAALQANRAAKLPAIDISPSQGKFLQLLAQSNGARRILEIGTLGGYSTLWLAGSLPADGRVITLEFNSRHAAVARSNFERAGLSDRIELREGPALESLAEIERAQEGPFDLFFIDADWVNLPQYFSWALKLARRGSLIVFDNVVRDGAIVDAHSRDAAVRATRELHERLGSEPRVLATALQTVGEKGHDGFAFALVLADLKLERAE
jgi:predicted O-methyltransferase YrrM